MVATQRRLTFEVNAGANNQIAHPTADDVAPDQRDVDHERDGRLLQRRDALLQEQRGRAASSFSNALTDSGSGPYSTTFPAIGTAGWTHALETDLTGPPYVSTAYSWTPNPTNPANQTLVGQDAAVQSANQVVTFVSDTSLPTGMSASVTAGYFTSLSVPVTLANGSDTGSGVNAASGIVQRDEALLDNGDGTCDAFPGSWGTVTLSGGNDTTVVSGRCYRYRYLISDNVGNQGTQAGTSGTAKVDTSAPSAPTLSYGSFTNTFLNGGVVYYLPSAANGQFQVTAAGSTDTQSGLASYSFPAAASGWSISGAGASRTYSHTGAPTDPAEPNNVFATNGAGLNSSNVSFTVTPDSTGPSVTAPTVTAGYFTTTSVGVTLNGGTDGGSGVAAGSSVVAARRGAARQQRWNLRRLPRVVVDGHALGWQRHDGRHRQVLPLPRAAFRQPRQPGLVEREQHGEDRHDRAQRPLALVRVLHERGAERRHSSGTGRARPTASSR